MKPSLIYMYNANKKQIIISLLLFIFVIAVAFVSLGNYIKQESGEVRQTIIVSFVLLVYLAFLAMIYIQAVSAFGKMTESTLFRLTSISGKKIVLATLLYTAIGLFIFEVISSIFLYSISMKIIKGTELYEVLFDQSVLNPLKHLFSTIVYIFNFSSILLILLFVVASVKVFALKKKKVEYPIVFFLFLLVTKLLGTIYDMLGGLAPTAPLITKLIYIDDSSGANVLLYPEKLMNLYSIAFSIGIFILLVYITGRIIDKKLEV
ncbi:ABC transporter permease [Bacillus sp. CH126_4D]|uniref:ABC transporter permease n=1 Tax=unclassified Bacillus (in: firmicutes) TaxID=185979 RepID=UPI00124C3197|nr:MULTISPECIES: ABC transporter permease [unclassified Bacillus (in: firmicutes)]KAB2454729.1 ABC transporter permease [Bacillus sp. CH140a_4T]KAB2473507.1 ABC transporter permease [Bacillus sp. CH126_4D]